MLWKLLHWPEHCKRKVLCRIVFVFVFTQIQDIVTMLQEWWYLKEECLFKSCKLCICIHLYRNITLDNSPEFSPVCGIHDAPYLYKMHISVTQELIPNIVCMNLKLKNDRTIVPPSGNFLSCLWEAFASFWSSIMSLARSRSPWHKTTTTNTTANNNVTTH